MTKEDKTYHFVYKTTNMINGKYYIGVHNTKNLNDGYLGSGPIILRSIKKYGKDNFKREIIEFCDTAEAAFLLESKLVYVDFVKEQTNYNVALGGAIPMTFGMVVVKDKNGGSGFLVPIDDPNFLSGELIALSSGRVNIKDNDGNTKSVSVNSPEYVCGEVKHILVGMVVVKDKNGNQFSVSVDDPRYISGELVALSKGRVLVKDTSGNTTMVQCDDPRYISGELKSVLVDNLRHKKTCPFCGRSGDCGNMSRHHFEYCISNPNRIPKPKRATMKYKESTCPHCGFVGRGGNMKIYHFDNCKRNPKNKQS